MGFTHEEDARRVMAVLPKRFERFGLSLHPDKTRLVPFRRPRQASPPPSGWGKGGTGTFDLLGFTHYWGRSLKGHWVVKRKTAAKRLTRAIQAIYQWCRLNRHRPLREQQQTLSRKMQGHYNYYGITCNGPSLSAFRVAVTRAWRKWLSRRKRGKPIPWPRFQRLLAQYPLPAETVVHSVYRTAAKP